MSRKGSNKITYEFLDQKLSKLPDIAQSKWFENYLNVSNKTLMRYRQIACLIPDYVKVCDRIWQHRTGETFEINQIWARMQGQQVVIDQPPFYRPQMEILIVIPFLLKEHQGKYESLKAHIKKNPKHWRSYYHAS